MKIENNESSEEVSEDEMDGWNDLQGLLQKKVDTEKMDRKYKNILKSLHRQKGDELNIKDNEQKNREREGMIMKIYALQLQDACDEHGIHHLNLALGHI